MISRRPHRRARAGAWLRAWLAAAIAGAGGEVRWNHEVPGAQRFHTDDPVGNRIEFQQVRAPKLDFTV